MGLNDFKDCNNHFFDHRNFGWYSPPDFIGTVRKGFNQIPEAQVGQEEKR